MSRFFTVNGKRYVAREIAFNTVCDLEDMGVSLQEMPKKTMSTARAYLAICANISKEDAGKEIEDHIKSGGKLEDIFNVFTEEINESGFFQALNQKADEATPEMENKESEKTPKTK